METKYNTRKDRHEEEKEKKNIPTTDRRVGIDTWKYIATGEAGRKQTPFSSVLFSPSVDMTLGVASFIRLFIGSSAILVQSLRNGLSTPQNT